MQADGGIVHVRTKHTEAIMMALSILEASNPPQSRTRRNLLGGAAVVGAAALAACSPPATTTAPTTEPADTPTGGNAQSSAAVELRVAMRKLWEDHITYTRNVIISAIAGLPDQQAVTQRLLRNQDDIGNAVKPYFGEAAGGQLSQLLRTHITQAAEVIGAAKASNQTQLAAKQQAWSANGREIAAFLSGANTNWDRTELENMLQRHLDLTTGEVVGRLGSDWAADIRSYDEGHDHMLMFADALTTGIVAQFPDRFA